MLDILHGLLKQSDPNKQKVNIIFSGLELIQNVSLVHMHFLVVLVQSLVVLRQSLLLFKIKNYIMVNFENFGNTNSFEENAPFRKAVNFGLLFYLQLLKTILGRLLFLGVK